MANIVANKREAEALDTLWAALLVAKKEEAGLTFDTSPNAKSNQRASVVRLRIGELETAINNTLKYRSFGKEDK